MAITIEENKSFPLWFRNSNNYVSEYVRCLGNLPITDQSNDISLIGGVSATAEKYWGGVLAPNGFIYCVPHSATTILKINPNDDTFTTFGNFAGNAKYCGGVLAPNGKIYFIPSSSTQVLVLDPSDDSTYTFGSISGGLYFWSSGSLNKEGTKIYCSPHQSVEILVIDVTNDTTYTFGSLPVGLYKYTSSCLAPNGHLYAFPSYGSDILKINTDEDTYTTVTSLSAVTNKYYSATLAPNGFIYGLPYFETNVIKFNPSDDTFVNIPISGVDRQGGSVLAPNGKIYGGGGNGKILIFDTNDDTYTSVPSGTSLNSGITMALNGKMYTIPRTSTSIAVIGDEITMDKDYPLSRFNNKF